MMENNLSNRCLLFEDEYDMISKTIAEQEEKNSEY